MQKFLFVVASTATLAMINPAKAQGYWVFPGYVFPGYIAPGYAFPRFGFLRYVFPRYVFPGYVAPPGYIAPPDYVAPSYVAPGYVAPPGYIAPPGYVSPGYQDWQRREYYEKLRGPIGMTTDTRNIGECAIGMSEETCRRRGQKYNPPKN